MRALARLGKIMCTTVLLFAVFTVVSVADDVSSSVTEQFMKNPDLPVIVRGDYFKAIQVAYQDFSKVLTRRGRDTNPSNNSNQDLGLRLSKIENYDIHVDQTPSTYSVWFRPSMRGTGEVVMGGGATYTVDRNTFSITERVLSK
jgi:hypothetical protein